MKIVIAPDKFKGSLTGIEFCNIVEKSIKSCVPDAEIIKLPLADGGDGMVEVLQFYTRAKMLSVRVKDPLHRNRSANYLYAEKNNLAFIEMAEASGIRLLKKEELNPLATSTFGTGELIKDAVNRACKHIIIGIGGSSTNDAGMGMARALGFQFYDSSGNELKGLGSDLNLLAKIDSKNVLPRLKSIKFEVACDVDNPLFGPNGAAFIYAPQKGATESMVNELDNGLHNFSRIVQKQFGMNLQGIPGAGAAGGLGAGCRLFLNATLESGTALIKKLADFDRKIKNADWIITGEGKFDQQTLSGKVIKGVLDSGSTQNIAVFCGRNELNAEQLKKHNITYIAELIKYASGEEDSIQHSAEYLQKTASAFAQNKLL